MTLSDAYLLARHRRVLPSALSSREQRTAFTAAVRGRAVFSARTTSLPYLEVMRAVLDDLLRGDRQTVDKDGEPWTESIGPAETRLRLKQALAALGYDPERGGFGTAAEAGLPPAERGSLQDLSSDRRLNLIIDVQQARWAAAGQQERGLQPAVLAAYPAWELAAGGSAEPRRDWPRRWMLAGGTLYGPAENRMIAAKASPVWQRLGTLEDFPDALDGGVPPFAFGSKRYWRGVSARECRDLGVELLDFPAPGKAPAKALPEAGSAAARLPVPGLDLPREVSGAGRDALAVVLKAEPTGRRLTYDERLARAVAKGDAAWNR